MNTPFVTADLPGIGGELRATPDHFVVEEVPLYDASGEGQHLYVNVTKVGLTTKDIQHRLMALFGVREADVGFAGMKDRHARTTQTFSISVGHISNAMVAAYADRIRQELPVTLNWARLHQNKLKTGHLLGNRFRIVISGLTQSPHEAQQAAQAIAARLQTTGVPNYFGPQRFGQNGANVERGIAVLKKKTYVKDRWLRRFLVSAYQSHLCNLYLAQRLELGHFDQLLLGDVAKKSATGGMFDVEDLAVEQPRYAAHEISFTAPLFGPKMWPATGEAGLLEQQILAAAPAGLDELKRAKVDGARRVGRLIIDDLTVRPWPNPESGSHGPLADSGDDDRRPSGPLPADQLNALEVAFYLPKGAFATTVLGEIMKVELAHVPDIAPD